MLTCARILVGVGLALVAWRITFVPGQSLRRCWRAVALDGLAPLGGFAWFLAATGRPLLSGALVLSILGALTFADRAKRRVLSEPALFSDLSLLILMVRHPALYLSYVGYGRFALGAAAIGGALAAALVFEPAVGGWTPWVGLIGFTLGLGVIWAMAGPLLHPLVAQLRRLSPSGEPEADAAQLGALACLLAHGLIARSERAGRQAAACPQPQLQSPPVIRTRPPPVVMVQAESFLDARRLGPAMPSDLLPAFEQCRSSSLQWGRLDVRGRGGNTMRTEFDVLTGLPSEAVGLDWRNPYHAFARRPVDSLAWRFRALGYRTVCIHPFDRTFFARDQVMPNLGFETFLGEEAFEGGVRDGRYIADCEVAGLTERLLREQEGLFLFAITVANHGPWSQSAEGGELGGWIEGLKRTDAMLGAIAQVMSRRSDKGLLAFFGDHPPSLPMAFEALAYREPTTDYLLWRDGEGQAPRRDCSASELSRTILAAAA